MHLNVQSTTNSIEEHNSPLKSQSWEHVDYTTLLMNCNKLLFFNYLWLRTVKNISNSLQCTVYV